MAADPAPDTTFRRPDLIQAVAERSDLKRSDCKLVLELVLEELGKALDGRDELALPPLGKMSIKKRKVAGAGEMLTIKLKRPPQATAAKPGDSAQDD
jgi:nucleoid DNA-binding protein